QHIADQRQLRFGMMEDNVAGCVAGAVANVEGQLANRHGLAIFQPTVGLEGLPRDAITLAVVLEPGNPEYVVAVRPFDRHAQFGSKNPSRAAMVDMAVGEE